MRKEPMPNGVPCKEAPAIVFMFCAAILKRFAFQESPLTKHTFHAAARNSFSAGRRNRPSKSWARGARCWTHVKSTKIWFKMSITNFCEPTCTSKWLWLGSLEAPSMLCFDRDDERECHSKEFCDLLLCEVDLLGTGHAWRAGHLLRRSKLGKVQERSVFVGAVRNSSIIYWMLAQNQGVWVSCCQWLSKESWKGWGK
jgi:hypothetical protein